MMTEDEYHEILDRLIQQQMDMLFEPIADGVTGFVIDHGPDGLEVGGIRAVTEGDGSVGRYLDALPTDRRVVVPYVVSERLKGMLARRGFLERHRFHPPIGWGPVWIRKAKPPPTV